MSFENEESSCSNGNTCLPMVNCAGGGGGSVNRHSTTSSKPEPNFNDNDVIIDWTRSDDIPLDNIQSSIITGSRSGAPVVVEGGNGNPWVVNGRGQSPFLDCQPAAAAAVTSAASITGANEPDSVCLFNFQNGDRNRLTAGDATTSNDQQPLPISPLNGAEVPIYRQPQSLNQQQPNPEQQQQQQRSSSSKTSSVQFNCGLRNLGNTCYINSCLQALFLTRNFRRYMNRKPNAGRLHCVLSKLFYHMEKISSRCAAAAATTSGQNNLLVQDSIRPDDFIHEFRSMKPQFIKNEQHDAQEFLSILLESIHQEVNAAKRPVPQLPEPKGAEEAWIQHMTHIDNSFLAKMFVGQVESCLKCLSCDNESFSWSCFWQIPLHLSDMSHNSIIVENPAMGTREHILSVEGCFKDFTASEVLGDDCAPFCEKCKKRRSSTKQQTICRAPHYMIIHLKRFNQSGTKITRKVLVNMDLTFCQKQYILYSCVLHRGTETMGHYFTLYNMNNPERRWLLFDDESIMKDVSEAQAEQIMQDYGYICFYKAYNRLSKVEPEPQPPPPQQPQQLQQSIMEAPPVLILSQQQPAVPITTPAEPMLTMINKDNSSDNNSDNKE